MSFISNKKRLSSLNLRFLKLFAKTATYKYIILLINAMADGWKKRLAGKESINIIVRPNSPKTEIKEFDSGKQAYRVNIKAVPEKGKANKDVIKYFTKLLKKDVKIVSGLKSRKKVLRIKWI